MNLLSIGISHATASVDIRERMWFTDAETRTALRALKESTFSECVLISTCNRTEVYGIHARPLPPEKDVAALLIDLKGAAGTVTRDHFTTRMAGDAVHQLFKVASGIDSMVIGDIQILNQVKEAFNLSREEGTLGPVTNRLMQAALHVGKRTRSETTLCEGAVSVSYAAVELAAKIFAELSRKSALLIGAGETGELTLRHLVGKGIGSVIIANRTREKADALVAEFGGTVVEYDRFVDALQTVDIAVTSVASPTTVLEPDVLHRVMKARSNDPLVIIDIGVPRNVSPAVRRIENVFLYDIDSLNAVVDRNVTARRGQIPRVSGIIQEELVAFFNWYHSLEVGPTIQQLRDALESIRAEEVGKNINRFRAEDRELLDILTKRIVNKILHEPITELRKGAENGSGEHLTVSRIVTLRDLFRLGRNGKAGDGR